MNEEQRLANQQVNQPKKEDKPEKDYSKYFEKVFTAPSLKDAKNVAKKMSSIIRILALQKSSQKWAKIAPSIFVLMAAK